MPAYDPVSDYSRLLHIIGRLYRKLLKPLFIRLDLTTSEIQREETS